MRSEGADQLQRLADALKEGGDLKLRRAVARSLRLVAAPMGGEIMREGAMKMPRRKGLAALIADGKMRMTVSLGGAKASVALRSTGLDYKSLNVGQLRHPVFARGDQTRKQWHWVTQRVPLYQFTDAFGRQAPRVRDALLGAIDETLTEIARKAAP